MGARWEKSFLKIGDRHRSERSPSSIVVEFAKESRPRRENHDAPERGYAPRRRPAGIRLVVDNISRDTSWQDLKDFGREAGNVSFADIDRDVPGRG